MVSEMQEQYFVPVLPGDFAELPSEEEFSRALYDVKSIARAAQAIDRKEIPQQRALTGALELETAVMEMATASYIRDGVEMIQARDNPNTTPAEVQLVHQYGGKPLSLEKAWQKTYDAIVEAEIVLAINAGVASKVEGRDPFFDINGFLRSVKEEQSRRTRKAPYVPLEEVITKDMAVSIQGRSSRAAVQSVGLALSACNSLGILMLASITDPEIRRKLHINGVLNSSISKLNKLQSEDSTMDEKYPIASGIYLNVYQKIKQTAELNLPTELETFNNIANALLPHWNILTSYSRGYLGGVEKRRLREQRASEQSRRNEEQRQKPIIDTEPMTNHRQELADYLAHLHKPWTLSKKQLKNLGLGELYKNLIVGGRTEGRILEGQPDSKAHQTVSVLNGLAELLQQNSYEQSLQILTEALQREAIINQDISLLSRHIRQHGLNGHAFGSELLDERLDWLRSNWDKIQHLLAKYWPNTVLTDLQNLVNLTPPSNLEIESGPDKESEIMDLPEIDPNLQKKAMQLDWVVLPPGISVEEIRKLTEAEYSQEEVGVIDWERLKNLITIQSRLGGNLYRSKSNSLGSRPPYFVLAAEINDLRFAIADNPALDNATYIIREDLTPGTWQEVLELTKLDVRKLGGRRIYHSAPNQHLRKILDTVQDLATTRVNA